MSATGSAPWWRSAVIYQVYIRSFADGNGDGVGDLAGIRSRLPYLKALGVDTLWINPWYKSPTADHGYDMADFREIDTLFGTVAEAEQLIEEAHRHDLRVIPDIVPNHTSNQHAWFQAALSAGPGSLERERYIFRLGRGPDGTQPPNNWVSVFGGPAWTQLPDGEWYLHLFTPKQPDLTGNTMRYRQSSSRSCGSGSTEVWTASASTSPTDSSKTPNCPTCHPARTRSTPGLGSTPHTGTVQ